MIKIQATMIKLQNMIFAHRQPLEEKIKEYVGKIVTNHHETITMKEQLELAIANNNNKFAMSEMANSSFTGASDHYIACRIVECGRHGHAKAKFANSCEGH